MTPLADLLPVIPFALLLVGLFVALALVVVLAVRRFCPWAQFERGNADLGQIFGTVIGTLFALVFAMVTVAVWDNYDRTALEVVAEANCLANVYHALDAYPPALAGPAQRQLRAYLQQVIEVEWPAQRRGGQDPVAHQLIAGLDRTLAGYRPPAPGELALHQQTLALLAQYRNLRQDRIRAGSAYLDAPMWISLAIGTGILLLFASLWRMPSLRQHLLLAGALGASLGTIFFLMLAYNHPFAGPGAIAPAPFRQLLELRWESP